MKTIQFDHHYLKLPGDVEARQTVILSVCKVFPFSLPKEFIDEDTQWYDWKDTHQLLNYPIEMNQPYLLILFATSGTVLWTTLRKWTSEKEAVYKEIIGDVVQIKITGEI